MRKAGWLLKRQSTGGWTAQSLHGARFHVEDETALPPELIRCLREEEAELAQGGLTPFSGTCRLSDPPLNSFAAPVAEHLAGHHLCKGHAVLRYRVSPDPAGDEALLAAGAWRVETETAPWMNPQPHSAPVAVVTCEHVCDVLPMRDRRRVYQQIRKTTAEDGVVYFVFFQLSALPESVRRSPFEDGYIVPYGKQEVFFRPHTEAMARKELLRELGGHVSPGWIQHHEFTCCWRPSS